MFQDLFSKLFRTKTIVPARAVKGYTLVEILVSMLIFGIVTISLSLPVCESIYLTANNQNIVRANNLARLYLKDTEILWNTKSNYDGSILPDSDNSSVSSGEHDVTSTEYTDDGVFEVKAYIQDLSTNDTGETVVRRVRIAFKDKDGKNLTDIYMDYDRK